MKHNRQYINKLKFQNRIFWVLVFFALVAGVLYLTRPEIVSPCGDNGCAVKVVYASEEVSELEQITAYIVKKWAKHGHSEQVHALSCFISESGLRTKAVGVNNNGSNDVGIAQINSVHGMSTEDRMDFKKNLDKAYKLYLRQGWTPWYGKGC